MTHGFPLIMLPCTVFSQPVSWKDATEMSFDGSDISNTTKTRCGTTTHSTCGESQRKRAISSYRKLRQLSFWILGKYCSEFIFGAPLLEEEESSPKVIYIVY